MDNKARLFDAIESGDEELAISINHHKVDGLPA